jgi:hypothetical protein
MNFPQQINSDMEKKIKSIMSNVSKKTSRCNQIAKIIIVIYYISHSHVRDIFTTLGYTQHFSLSSQLSPYWCWSKPFNILINANNCFRFQFFWGPFEIESFRNPKKLLIELH